MSDNEMVKSLEQLFDRLGIDTSCEISFEMKHLESPCMKVKGTRPSIMSGLNMIMIYCMDSLFDNTKDKLDCLNRIYMDAKKEIIRRGEEDEATKKADKCNETDIE